MSRLSAVITIPFVLFFLTWFFFFKEDTMFTNLPLPSGEPLKIIAIGDSLVEGVGAPEGKDFPNQVSILLNIPIQNSGVSGNTSAQVLERLPKVLEQKPNIIILLVGGNDALQKISKETTFKNIETSIQKIHASGAAVLLIGVQGGIVGNSYQKEFDRLAKEYSTLYIPDILDGLIGDSRYMSDAVHPNEAGYTIIAQKVANILVPHIAKK